MNMTGQDVIDRIVQRLDEEGVRCYDSAIVAKLKSLNNLELNQLTQLGDVVAWRNERTESASATPKENQ